MSSEIETTVDEDDGVLTAKVSMPRDHRSLDGDGVVSVPVTVANITVRAEEETVKALADALHSWYAEQQDAAPLGPKSVTQKMDEVYDR